MFANNYVNHEKDRSLEVPDLRHPLKMTYGQRCQLYHNFELIQILIISFSHKKPIQTDKKITRKFKCIVEPYCRTKAY